MRGGARRDNDFSDDAGMTSQVMVSL